jgi:hypothetical protein
MGKVRIRVENEDRIIRKIKRDFKRGMDKSSKKIAESGRNKALDIINQNQAYFNYEVAKGFRIIEGADSPGRSSIKLINEAPHAGALDAGVPASEYADGGPPVQNLLPWVERKMRGWDLDVDSDGAGSGRPTIILDSGTYELPEGFRENEDDDLDYHDLYFDQEVKVEVDADNEVKTGYVSEISGGQDDYEVIVDIDGTEYVFSDGERAGFRFVALEPFEELDDAEQYARNKKRLRWISHDYELRNDIDRFREVLRTNLFEDSKDQSQVKRQLDSITRFSNYTGQYEAAVQRKTAGADDTAYQSEVMYRPRNGRSTIVHEYFHVFHNSNRYLASYPSDNKPDWDYDENGESSTYHDVWAYALRYIDPNAPSKSLRDSNADDFKIPGYDQGFQRAIAKNLDDSNPDDYYTLVKDKEATELFKPGDMGLEAGDIFQITTARGTQEQFLYHGVEAKQYAEKWEIPATGWGGTHDSAMFTVDENGNPTGDVTFDGLIEVTTPQTDLDVEQVWENNQFHGPSIPWDTSTVESDLFTKEDGFKMKPGDLLWVYNEAEGEEQYIRLDEYVNINDQASLTGYKYGDSDMPWYFKGETAEDVFSYYEIKGYFSPDKTLEVHLEHDDPVDRLIEAVNITWLDIAYQVSAADKSDPNWYTDIDWIGRRYSGKAANETITTISELLTYHENDNGYLNEAAVQDAYYNYPWLVQAWSEMWPLSDAAKQALEEVGAEIDEDGVVRAGY